MKDGKCIYCGKEIDRNNPKEVICTLCQIKEILGIHIKKG